MENPELSSAADGDVFYYFLKEGVNKMANEVGKRYVCTQCNAEFVVIKGGKGELKCCGKPMEIKKK